MEQAKTQYIQAMVRHSSFEKMLEEQGFFVWVTRGCSMWPLLKTNRDVVEIRRPANIYPDGRLRKNDVALYKIPTAEGKGKYILHRVLAVRNGHYVICGDNNIYLEKVLNEQVIGVMTSLFRKGKKVDLNGWCYRLYVALWGGHFKRRVYLRKVICLFACVLRPVYRRLAVASF